MLLCVIPLFFPLWLTTKWRSITKHKCLYTLHQGTWKISIPLCNLKWEDRTLVGATEPRELVSLPHSHLLQSEKKEAREYKIGWIPTGTREFVEVQPAWEENLACHQSRIEISLEAEERVDTCQVSPRVTLQGAELLAAASPAEVVGSSSLSYRARRKQNWWAATVVWVAGRRTYFSPAAPIFLRKKFRGWEEWEKKKESR